MSEDRSSLCPCGLRADESEQRCNQCTNACETLRPHGTLLRITVEEHYPGCERAGSFRIASKFFRSADNRVALVVAPSRALHRKLIESPVCRCSTRLLPGPRKAWMRGQHKAIAAVQQLRASSMWNAAGLVA